MKLFIGRMLMGTGVASIVLSLALAAPMSAYASSSAANCTNGGGGNTTCAKDSTGTCSEATSGKKCDTPADCNCTSTASGCPCQ